MTGRYYRVFVTPIRVISGQAQLRTGEQGRLHSRIINRVGPVIRWRIRLRYALEKSL